MPAKGWRKRQIMRVPQYARNFEEHMRVLPDFFYTPVCAYLLGLLMGYLLRG